MTICHHDMSIDFTYHKICVLCTSTHCTNIVSLEFSLFLRYPVVNDHIPNLSIWKKITNYLTTTYGQTQAHYLQLLPKEMPQWGKVHIGNGGDCIHAAIAWQ